jgi:hypothetical protein
MIDILSQTTSLTAVNYNKLNFRTIQSDKSVLLFKFIG